MKRVTFVLLLLFALPGCESLALLEGASAVTTGERMSDRVISLSSGKTCSMKRKSRGLTYCEEDEAVPVQSPYCYRSLGGVTCYEREPAFGASQQKVGDGDPNATNRP
jgi:hypothetical protein